VTIFRRSWTEVGLRLGMADDRDYLDGRGMSWI
jgi:hypothetical protein